MYAHYPPQASVLQSSAAQRVDGDLRMRAPGFRSSTSLLLGVTPRAHTHDFVMLEHHTFTVR